MSLNFTAIIRILGINPYVPVSAARAKKLHPDWKKPMPVLVKINGKPEEPWKINMMPKGDGSFYLYLHGEVRTAAGTKVGDKVTVDISFDKNYKSGPQHPLPPSLKKAISKHAEIKKAWEALIPSRQKEILRYLHSLKSEEAKERNISKVIYVLSGKKARFMAHDWKDGK